MRLPRFCSVSSVSFLAESVPTLQLVFWDRTCCRKCPRLVLPGPGQTEEMEQTHLGGCTEGREPDWRSFGESIHSFSKSPALKIVFENRIKFISFPALRWSAKQHTEQGFECKSHNTHLICLITAAQWLPHSWGVVPTGTVHWRTLIPRANTVLALMLVSWNRNVCILEFTSENNEFCSMSLPAYERQALNYIQAGWKAFAIKRNQLFSGWVLTPGGKWK